MQNMVSIRRHGWSGRVLN